MNAKKIFIPKVRVEDSSEDESPVLTVQDSHNLVVSFDDGNTFNPLDSFLVEPNLSNVSTNSNINNDFYLTSTDITNNDENTHISSNDQLIEENTTNATSDTNQFTNEDILIELDLLRDKLNEAIRNSTLTFGDLETNDGADESSTAIAPIVQQISKLHELLLLDSDLAATNWKSNSFYENSFQVINPSKTPTFDEETSFFSDFLDEKPIGNTLDKSSSIIELQNEAKIAADNLKQYFVSPNEEDTNISPEYFVKNTFNEQTAFIQLVENTSNFLGENYDNRTQLPETYEYSHNSIEDITTNKKTIKHNFKYKSKTHTSRRGGPYMKPNKDLNKTTTTFTKNFENVDFLSTGKFLFGNSLHDEFLFPVIEVKNAETQCDYRRAKKPYSRSIQLYKEKLDLNCINNLPNFSDDSTLLDKEVESINWERIAKDNEKILIQNTSSYETSKKESELSFNKDNNITWHSNSKFKPINKQELFELSDTSHKDNPSKDIELNQLSKELLEHNDLHLSVWNADNTSTEYKDSSDFNW